MLTIEDTGDNDDICHIDNGIVASPSPGSVEYWEQVARLRRFGYSSNSCHHISQQLAGRALSGCA